MAAITSINSPSNWSDVCLFAESARALQRVCDHVSTVIDEYGLKLSEKKSKVVCINGI